MFGEETYVKSRDLNWQERNIFQDISVSVMGILNDATGTLMSCAHKEPDCSIGVIIGELTMVWALFSVKAWLLEPTESQVEAFKS